MSEQTQVAAARDLETRDRVTVAVENTRKGCSLESWLNIVRVKGDNGPIKDRAARKIWVQLQRATWVSEMQQAK